MIQIKPDALLDEHQKRVIFKIQEHTVPLGITLTVTRGHSTPLEQLNTIERLARKNKCLFTDFIPGDIHTRVKVWRSGKQFEAYAWAQTLSSLLFKDFIINGPFQFTCLEHYIRSTGEDMFLKIINPSPHIKALDDPNPCPLDFSSKIDRDMKTERVDIHLVTDIMVKAQAAGAGIRFIKPEPRNGCVHVDLDRS